MNIRATLHKPGHDCASQEVLGIRNMKIQNNSNEIEIISQNVPNNALYQSEEECKDQESIQSSTTPDSGHQMGK